MSFSAEHISFAYGDRRVLTDISFSAEPGEILSVLGANGVGKSTLFRCMLGTLTPQSGQTLIDGRSIRTMTATDLAKSIAYIPQSHSPVFNFTVLDMVLMGTASQLGRFASPGARQNACAMAALERLGIAELCDAGYQNISGGQRQMVLIARALAQQAKILVMDEPSASLDFGNRIRLMRTIRQLASEGYTVIQSTHDPDQAYYYSDRILALKDGRILAWDAPEKVLDNELIDRLYDIEVEVCSIRDGRIQMCIPKE